VVFKKFYENNQKLNKEVKDSSKIPLDVDKKLFQKIQKEYIEFQKISNEKITWGEDPKTPYQKSTNVINNIHF
jgi:hypothetical protein